MNPKRSRAYGGGRVGALRNEAEQLFVALFYLKVYPTFDVLGFFISSHRSQACRRIAFLMPLLEKTLGRQVVLPKRKIESVKEVFERFPEVKDLFIDGTERPVQKPKNPKRRKKLYSGKKKMTTRKIVVAVDERRRIHLLTPTKSGRRHDKRILDKYGGAQGLPNHITLWADSGFWGMQKQHPSVQLPYKGSRKKPLDTSQKLHNRLLAGLRVIAEHAIGGIKRFGAASGIYRNRKANFDDLFHHLAAGLWNYHLIYS